MPLCRLGLLPPDRWRYTVEREGNVITVTPPAGYAEKGYYKLFWKNEATGEIQSDVFPVDTESYKIDAEEGAEYTFQLHYAKTKGKLPAGWKGATISRWVRPLSSAVACAPTKKVSGN